MSPNVKVSSVGRYSDCLKLNFEFVTLFKVVMLPFWSLAVGLVICKSQEDGRMWEYESVCQSWTQSTRLWLFPGVHTVPVQAWNYLSSIIKDYYWHFQFYLQITIDLHPDHQTACGSDPVGLEPVLHVSTAKEQDHGQENWFQSGTNSFSWSRTKNCSCLELWVGLL